MGGVESHCFNARYRLDAAVVQPFSRPRVRTLRSWTRMPTSEVAPGVHRLGNAYVNCYLIEDGNQLTLVDAGLPGFRPQLDEYLRSRGRSVADIAAVILTHAHPDHVGMAEGVRRRRARARARARGRRADGPHRQGPQARRHACSPTSATRRSGGCSRSGARSGALRTPKIGEVTTFTRRRPRRPRPPARDPHARPLPRPRRVPPARPRRADRRRRALHLQPADRRARAAADAEGVRRTTSLQALASLDALERPSTPASLLFGHGEPWTDGPAAAVAHAREVGVT